MKKLLPTGIALALFLSLGLAQPPVQEPAPQPDVESAKDDAKGDVSARLKALEAEVATLKAELAASKTMLDETTRYLAGAKARSEALLKTFDQAQEQGFTAGINFTSRETLLAGFRAYAKGESEGLPGAKPATETAAKR